MTDTIPVVAIYFPQFHRVAENDKFWGDGFTEWTWLRDQKANRIGEPIRQPHPTQTTYYDALDIDTRRRQAAQARHAGITAFAYYHYWTQDRPVMDGVLRAMLDDGEPSIQHCLVWANISWTNKWDGASEVLLPQTYASGPEGWELHYQFLKPFWSSPKAFRIRDAVVFAVYHPSDMGWGRFDQIVGYFRTRWGQDTGGQTLHIVTYDNTFLWNEGFHHHPQVNAALLFEPMRCRARGSFDRLTRQYIDRRDHRPAPTTEAYPYWETVTASTLYARRRNSDIDVYLTAVAGWDNSPRYEAQGRTSVFAASVWSEFDPSAFESHVRHVMRTAPQYASTPVVWINAWNEWNEQAVLEPCTRFGTALLDKLHAILVRLDHTNQITHLIR